MALLLTSDEAQAAATLRSAMRRMIDTPLAGISEATLSAALVASLPPDRRRLRRRMPAWARLPAARAEAPLVAALAQLPRQQRLALGLTFLHGFDAPQAAAVLGSDEAQVRVLTRDALRALARHAGSDLALADLDVDSAPEACRSTRAAIALGADLAHADPATRGHLALCSDCRAAEQTWLRLTTTVENALRGALRTITFPEYLNEDLRAALARAPAQPRHGLLAYRRVRLMLVAVIVFVMIALLVMPRRREPAILNGTTAGAGVELAPRDLVGRALDRLYAPPDGSGVWHGRWEIRWSFAGGSYATLNADAWVDTATSRHRLQLVHHDGGGPFEFELVDDAGNLWYATTASYAPSLYPPFLDQGTLRTRVRLPSAEQERMRRERLESGAWNLAGDYLRQARASRDLQNWGRRRAEDGAQLEVIGFDGFSPLAPPLDAPDTTAVSTTILLSIDTQSGALREVRELAGVGSGERDARTTWRFVQGEWLAGAQDITAAFDPRRAWNGTGDFAQGQQGIADPALPLTPANAVLPLANGAREIGGWLWMPTAAPNDATRAVFFQSPGLTEPSAVIAYFGVGRRLMIQTAHGNSADPPPPNGERITLDGREFVLVPATAQGYRARIAHDSNDQQFVTWVSATGYTRAELLNILRSLGPLTGEAYRAQARLVADPQPRDQAAFDALLGALAPPPSLPPNSVRHFVERTFTRHNPAPDPLGDPYHRLPYGGRPEQLLTDNWLRPAGDGGFETAAIEHSDDGTIFGRQYSSPTTLWNYDATTSYVNRQRTSDLPLVNQINRDQADVLALLARGGSGLSTLPDGTRVISNSQPLLESELANVFQSQQQDPNAEGPYMGDVNSDACITTLIYLDSDGHPKRIESRVSGVCTTVSLPGGGSTTQFITSQGSSPQDGILLASWELARDEQLPDGRVPAGTFDATPPAAQTVWDSTAPQRSAPPPEPDTVAITDVLTLARTPLFGFPPDPKAGAPVVQVMHPSNDPPQFFGNDLFDAALRSGIAIRLTYWLPTDGSTQRLTYVYEGAAEPFRAYLRVRTTWGWSWLSSTPFRLAIGERSIDGWRITTQEGALWTLFEADGTLVAIQSNDAVQQAALATLQPLPRP